MTHTHLLSWQFCLKQIMVDGPLTAMWNMSKTTTLPSKQGHGIEWLSRRHKLHGPTSQEYPSPWPWNLPNFCPWKMHGQQRNHAKSRGGLVGAWPTPLKNDGVSEWKSDWIIIPTIGEVIKFHGSKPPTNQPTNQGKFILAYYSHGLLTALCWQQHPHLTSGHRCSRSRKSWTWLASPDIGLFVFFFPADFPCR